MATIFAWWGGGAIVMSALGPLADPPVTGQVPGLVSGSRERYKPAHLRLPLRPSVVMSLGTGVLSGRPQRLSLPRHREPALTPRALHLTRSTVTPPEPGDER
jgi:hypothetical protein